MPNRRDPAAAELAELFTHTARRLRRGSAAQLAPLGLTYGQARALRLVVEAGRPLRMADLASHLEVVPRSATTMVDALAGAGLVARATDPADRRSVLVSPTDGGRRLLAAMARARHDIAEEVFGGLRPDQRRDLLGLLTELCEQSRCGTCCRPHRTGDAPAHHGADAPRAHHGAGSNADHRDAAVHHGDAAS